MALKNLLGYTRANHYTQSVKYKGIPIIDSQFFKNLPLFSIYDLTSANVESIAVKSLMFNIIDETKINGYLLQNQIPLYPAVTSPREISDSIHINNTEFHDDF